jgi:hypothetical protein
MQYLKNHGMTRVYWIDYPYNTARLADAEFNGVRRSFLEDTYENFGGDPLPQCIEIAHEIGLEFICILKPYDLWCWGRARLDDDRFAEHPEVIGGYAMCLDPFLKEHPEFAFRRHPDWTTDVKSRHVSMITLYSDNAEPLSFNAADIKIFTSDDNVTYKAVPVNDVVDDVVTRPRYDWSPAGKQECNETEEIRRITIELDASAVYWAVQLPDADDAGEFGNQLFLLTEVITDDGETAHTIAISKRSGGKVSGGFTAGELQKSGFESVGFDYARGSSPACWIDMSEGAELRRALSPGDAFGFALGQDSHYIGMLDPSFSEVREYWSDCYVKRALDFGADGVDVRIEHHHVSGEWLAYGYAEPILETFKSVYDRLPEATDDDYTRIRTIRGEFHTQFLREISETVHAAGKKLEVHVGCRMKAPANRDSFLQIYWDIEAWITEGIIDGINMKYIGPLSTFTQQILLPLARAQGIPVHMIAAVGDPRSMPRTPEYSSEQLALCAAGGINSINLYELWVYLRTTPRGEWFMRGCADPTFKELKRTLETL